VSSFSADQTLLNSESTPNCAHFAITKNLGKYPFQNPNKTDTIGHTIVKKTLEKTLEKTFSACVLCLCLLNSAQLSSHRRDAHALLGDWTGNNGCSYQSKLRPAPFLLSLLECARLTRWNMETQNLALQLVAWSNQDLGVRISG
jgi:hypothetical protein